MPNCQSLCIAEGFDFERLQREFLRKRRATVYREVIHIEQEAGDVFLFRYGVVVLWAVEHDVRQALLGELQDYVVNPLDPVLEDHFAFRLEPGGERMHLDTIYLASDAALAKLAVSHGLAQSVKLEQFEEQAAATIISTHHIPRRLADTGSTALSRREITRMRGRLYLVEADIKLKYDLLDTPEFFWEYPEQESLYLNVVRYLDLQPRIEVLEQKLLVIRDLFEMLADERNHKHSALLEWIIIWLITVEVVYLLVHDIFHLI